MLSCRHQAKLQHNLMYLAAIADSQPPQTAPLSQVRTANASSSSACLALATLKSAFVISEIRVASLISLGMSWLQYPSNLMMQPGPRYMPPQSGQMMNPQSLMAARSSMMYAHPSLSPLQQQQAAHGQLGMAPGGGGGGTTSGFSILHGEASMGGGGAGAGAGNNMMNAGMFSGFGRSGSGAKEGSTSLSVDVRGGTSSGAQSGDGEYLKVGTEEEGS